MPEFIPKANFPEGLAQEVLRVKRENSPEVALANALSNIAVSGFGEYNKAIDRRTETAAEQKKYERGEKSKKEEEQRQYSSDVRQKMLADYGAGLMSLKPLVEGEKRPDNWYLEPEKHLIQSQGAIERYKKGAPAASAKNQPLSDPAIKLIQDMYAIHPDPKARALATYVKKGMTIGELEEIGAQAGFGEYTKNLINASSQNAVIGGMIDEESRKATTEATIPKEESLKQTLKEKNAPAGAKPVVTPTAKHPAVQASEDIESIKRKLNEKGRRALTDPNTPISVVTQMVMRGIGATKADDPRVLAALKSLGR